MRCARMSLQSALIVALAFVGACGGGGGSSGPTGWVRRAGVAGTSGEGGFGVAAFPDGSSVVVGTYENGTLFGIGEPGATTLLSPSGGANAFVARYDAAGSLKWARGQPNPGGYDNFESAAAMPGGDAVVVGSFTGSVTFGAGELAETTLAAVGPEDALLARYASNGMLVWAKRAGDAVGTTRTHRVASLPDGSCVVTGQYQGAATFGLGETNETTLADPPAFGIFIARYALDGTLAWARGAFGAGIEQGYGIAGLGDGSCLVTGNYEFGTVFGDGEPGETVLGIGYPDGGPFVARYDPDGFLVWARGAKSTGFAQGNSLAALPDQSFYVVGYHTDSLVLGAGEPNETTLTASTELVAFIARYAPDGSLYWARNSTGNRTFPTTVTTLSDQSAVLVGHLDGTATFGSGGPLPVVLTAWGDADAFFARYDSAGTLVWAFRAGGVAAGGSDHEGAVGVSAFPDDSFVMTGFYVGPSSFGDGGRFRVLLPPFGGRDIFLARYGPDGSL